MADLIGSVAAAVWATCERFKEILLRQEKKRDAATEQEEINACVFISNCAAYALSKTNWKQIQRNFSVYINGLVNKI